jgi:hypothetical protein
LNQLHLNRFPNQIFYRSPDDNAMGITLSMMVEAISHDGGNFGSRLESNVPNQKETGDYSLEYVINEHFDRIERAEIYTNKLYPDIEERCKGYKESVTLEKLQNLYRYGWRLGEKLTDGLMRNHDVLHNFIFFWDDFCKKNSAEEIANYYKGIVFRIYKDSEGILSWVATFEPKYAPSYESGKRFKLSGGNIIPEVPDVAIKFFPRINE